MLARSALLILGAALAAAHKALADATKPVTPPVTPPPVTPPVVQPPVTTPPVVPPPSAAGNVTLRGRRIYRPNGTELIARGPEIVGGSVADIDAIAATGANAMRMLLVLDAANGMTPAGFDVVLARAAFHKMIVWVSLHIWNEGANHLISSALGGGNFYSLNGGSKQNPAPCYLAVWQRQWLKDLMNKHRATVILDAAQEFVGGGESDAQQEAWAASGIRAIGFFRAQGYTQPLTIMSNFEGRDLAAIVRRGELIRAADTVRVEGQPQTGFAWQAYWWGDWYPSWQGGLLLGAGRTLSAAQAITDVVPNLPFPVEVGIDNYAGDTNVQYKAQMDAAARLGIGWLWWSWKDGTVEAPVSGAACQDYVLRSLAGFAGAAKG